MTIPGLLPGLLPDDDSDFPLFASPCARKHPAPSTAKHWQLRDLLHCPRTGELVHVHGRQVLRHRVPSRSSAPLFHDLAFHPCSATAAHGYVAAGGERSELTVRRDDDSWFASTSLGGSINNALAVVEHHAGTRLYVSNNDMTVKVLALPTLDAVATLPLPTAVNYTAVSPDGRTLVAVGDTPEVFVFDVSASGEYTHVETLTASKDSGFCCAWNRSSRNFAVASQDGAVSVWDVRMPSRKLARLQSRQGGTRGAARCLKYSPAGGVDLLAFSEHQSYVHLVDARTYASSQAIRTAPPGADPDVAGIAFSPDCRSLYAALNSQIVEFEVDLVARRSFPAGEIR
ncbi:hypothetical protein DFJ74DRAFT_715569 [Hyaloraphidium curvatum]|nr:hypothetical protein DFJ74DRAFT_715569 [Hyaloraphidium curvatum]